MQNFKNKEALVKLFNNQKKHQLQVGNSTYKQRLNKLNNLKIAIEKTYRKRIHEALYADFKKPFIETDLTEIYPIISEIKHVKFHLKSWMKKQRVATPIALLGSSSYIKYEPKGVCLIISPWNFPINLTFSPLISAIAAGNTVIIKPSELTPNASQLMKEIVEELFDEHEITLVEGEAETSQELLKLPFNHIFFTGSPSVGKLVMEAAAKNLSSITLELGGKSPTIIDKTANLNTAAKKIIWGKFINNGQTCIAPDYILVHHSVKSELLKELKKQISKFYSKNPATSSSYCRIVNKKHFNRLKNYILKAKESNASIELGGNFNNDTNYIEPTIISNLSENSDLLQEEIFGPILPIISFQNLNKAINYVNSKEKPLALYIYSKNNKTANFIINNTRAGGTCINNNIIHYSNHNLPFGGSNNSGIGKSHGLYGFQEFSNKRAILKQHTKGSIEFLFPPYSELKQRLANFTIKWL